MSDFAFKDNSAEVLSALENAVKLGLEAIGMTAEGYAKEKAPVNTGRLRNSVSHVSDSEAAYIGTNVEYAPYVELGTVKMGARPFLKPAAEEHADEYREIMENAMKNA